MESNNRDLYVLMFSGGRDSTLAAIQLASSGSKLVLVTLISCHLHGIESVHRRLWELLKYLPEGTEWFLVRQPNDLCVDTRFYEPTCLPCHHAYVTVGVRFARTKDAAVLAFGYAGYQRTWPEQSPLAVSELSNLLADEGISLSLPVYGFDSKEAMKDALNRAGLSDASLEQKCSQQVNNVELNDDELSSQVAFWGAAIRKSIANESCIPLETIDHWVVEIGEWSKRDK